MMNGVNGKRDIIEEFSALQKDRSDLLQELKRLVNDVQVEIDDGIDKDFPDYIKARLESSRALIKKIEGS
jgi:hypothetical protein